MLSFRRDVSVTMTPPRPFPHRDFQISTITFSKTDARSYWVKSKPCECFIVGIVAFRESEENAIALVGRESLLVSLVIWLECSVGRYCSAIVHLGF